MARQDLDIFQPGSADYDKAMKTATEKAASLAAYVEWTNRRIDEENSVMLARLYEKIKKTLDAMSADYGYDIVFVDDSVVDLPSSATQSDMMRQISAQAHPVDEEGRDRHHRGRHRRDEPALCRGADVLTADDVSRVHDRRARRPAGWPARRKR